MQSKRSFLALSTAAALAGVVGVSTAWAQAAPPTVRVDGSSTVFPLSEAVAEEFQRAKRGAVRVTVGTSGTGGGFRSFCRGELDVTGASRPARPAEIEACRAAGVRFIELPVAFDALTVAVHRDNTWARQLTVQQLRTIWEPAATGRITNWRQIDPAFPDLALTLFGPGTASGTFDYFTEAINGRSGQSRTDFMASEDDNVIVMGVARDRGALGYFGMSYYLANQGRLRAVSIVPAAGGAAVAPTMENVIAGTYQPLARPLFIYVSERSLQRPEVRQFAEFYLTNGARLAREVGYVPLPAEAYTIGAAHLRDNRVGTRFATGEATVGVRIQDVMQRAPL
jgi:phosphate transport system substrate-binding protein